MGTRVTQRKRGKGGPRYLSPGHRFFSKIAYDFDNKKQIKGEVVGFIDDAGRHPLLAAIMTEDGSLTYNIACEGQAIGQKISIMSPEFMLGNTLKLADIPEGTPIYNIESSPGDGGKIARSSGSFAYRLAQDEDNGVITIQLSSKKIIQLRPECLATIGIACGGGKNELPFMKAGTKGYAMHARNRLWPKVRGRAMSAYDHPYGGKTGGKPTAVKRSAPPGRKSGHIAASSTGRKKSNAK